MTKLEELKSRHAELKQQILDESKSAFNELTASLFAKYPKLESFSWRQYTPYFNDGDECVFSAQTDYLNVMWGGAEIEELSDYTFTSSYTEEPVKSDMDLKALNGELRALFKNLDGAVLKDMFGDHCKVIAKRGGVTVEQYEHD